MMTIALLILPIFLLALGFPIFIVLLAAVSAAIMFVLELPSITIHQVMFGGVDKYALLAVPFFIFAGELMNKGGISHRLVAWMLSAVGHVRGSLGLTTIGTSTFMGAISGSSPATVAACGRVLYPALIENRYGRKFSLGLVTSSGSIAIIVPPSIAMIVYAAAAEQSVPKLFLGGVLPGLLIAIMMALYVIYFARKNNIRESGQFKASEFFAKTRQGIGAIIMPVVILGGIYSGLFSPTESAGIACIYAIILIRFGYRALNWPQVFQVAGDAAYLTSQIMIIVAVANVFSWVLTVAQIPQQMVEFLTQTDVPSWCFLLLINLLLLTLGCVIDPLSAILVLTPLMVPIATHLNIDLIHFGIIMTVNLSIGMCTPPFGLNIFVTNSLFDSDFRTICLGLIPFILIQVFALMVITYVPSLTLVMANLI